IIRQKRGKWETGNGACEATDKTAQSETTASLEFYLSIPQHPLHQGIALFHQHTRGCGRALGIRTVPIGADTRAAEPEGHRAARVGLGLDRREVIWRHENPQVG